MAFILGGEEKRNREDRVQALELDKPKILIPISKDYVTLNKILSRSVFFFFSHLCKTEIIILLSLGT